MSAPRRSDVELAYRTAAAKIRREHRRGRIADYLTPEFALAIADMMSECADAEHQLEGEGGRLLGLFLDEWEEESREADG